MGDRIGVERAVDIAEPCIVKQHGAVPGDDAAPVIPQVSRGGAPVQVRRFVEISGQQNQVSLFACGLLDEFRNCLIPCGASVHAQNGLRIGHGRGELLPRNPVISPGQVAGVMRVIEVRRIEQDVVAFEIDAYLHVDATADGRKPGSDLLDRVFRQHTHVGSLRALVGLSGPEPCLTASLQGSDQSVDRLSVRRDCSPRTTRQDPRRAERFHRPVRRMLPGRMSHPSRC